jgi:P27 family predicted phage terminase small subunit
LRRGRKALKQGEVKLKAGYPTPPNDLDPVALSAWESVCDDLKEQGNLVVSDRKLIELYARTYSLMKKAEDELETEDLNLVAANGRAFINPAANVQQTCISRLQRILNDLRLSPVTRSNAIGVNDVDSPIANLFKEMGDS